ncbi:MAG: hypothetical protein ACRC92_26905 [Peptostreptococcaceae bacterium]
MKKMILNKINGDYRLIEASSIKHGKKAGIRYQNGVATNRVVITCDIGTILDAKSIDVIIHADVKKFFKNGIFTYSSELDKVLSEAVGRVVNETIKGGF